MVEMVNMQSSGSQANLFAWLAVAASAQLLSVSPD